MAKPEKVVLSKLKLTEIGLLQDEIEGVSQNAERYRRSSEMLTRYGKALEDNLDNEYLPGEAKKHIRICGLVGRELGALGRFYDLFPQPLSMGGREAKLKEAIDEAKTCVKEQETLGIDRRGDLEKYDLLLEKKRGFDMSGGREKGANHASANTIVKEITERAKKVYEIEALEATFGADL